MIQDRRNNADLIEAIADAVRGEISRLTVSAEMHYEHHEFIREWIEERKRKREWRDKVKAQVGGWMIISILGVIGTGAWTTFQYFRDHLK